MILPRLWYLMASLHSYIQVSILVQSKSGYFFYVKNEFKVRSQLDMSKVHNDYWCTWQRLGEGMDKNDFILYLINNKRSRISHGVRMVLHSNLCGNLSKKQKNIKMEKSCPFGHTNLLDVRRNFVLDNKYYNAPITNCWRENPKVIWLQWNQIPVRRKCPITYLKHRHVHFNPFSLILLGKS